MIKIRENIYVQWNLSNLTPSNQGNKSDGTGCRNNQILFQIT